MVAPTALPIASISAFRGLYPLLKSVFDGPELLDPQPAATRAVVATTTMKVRRRDRIGGTLPASMLRVTPGVRRHAGARARHRLEVLRKRMHDDLRLPRVARPRRAGAASRGD